MFRPYLTVRGIPSFMNQQIDFLKSHFETLSKAQIRSIEFKGEEAFVYFVDPRGMLLLVVNLISPSQPNP